MNEEYENNENIIKVEDSGENEVKITIINQVKRNFEKHKIVDETRYTIGSIDSVEYRNNNYKKCLYLKGDNDFRTNRAELIVNKCDWAVFEGMLIKEDFKIVTDEIELETEKTDGENKTSFKSILDEPTKEEIEKMISLVDLNTFTSIIKARMQKDGDCGEDIGKVNRNWAKKYLCQWAKAKYRLYKLLGNKLKLEEDIEINPDNNYYYTRKKELESKFPLYAPIFSMFSETAFKEDILDSNRCWESILNDKRVTQGMKLTRFFALYGSRELDDEIAKIYQNKDKAHISISIDPNDFLTVSINSSGWRSCHNFIDGEWRNAGLSYMIDRVSAVAYKSNNEVNYRFDRINFKWNSKNWRQMVYISEVNSTMVFSRQYPNESDELTKNIRRILEQKVSEYYNAENIWKVYSDAGNANVEVDNESLLYNDVDNGFGHKVVKNKTDIDLEKEIAIHLGGIPKSVTNANREIWESEGNIC